jgi:Cu+-exporting ATPase
MKTLKKLVACLFLVVAFAACKNNEQPEIKTVDTEVTAMASKLDPNATYAKAEFTIDGMTCAMGCAKTIEKKIAKMEGVKSAEVDFDRRLAMVEYDEAQVTPASLEATVSKVAETYKVNDMKTVEAFSEAKKACEEDCKKRMLRK